MSPVCKGELTDRRGTSFFPAADQSATGTPYDGAKPLIELMNVYICKKNCIYLDKHWL